MGEIEAQVCIVGGGIAGMTAAYRLQQAGVSCVVLEADSRLGGRIKTVEVGGCAFDVGAIGLLGSYTETVKLIDELGLKPKLSRAAVCLAIPREGRLNVLDLGRPASLLRAHLLSARSLWRLRKLLGPMVHYWPRLNFLSMGGMAPEDTESADVWCRRVLNEEIYEYLIGPIIRALWQRDPEGTPMVDVFWGLKAFAPTMYALFGGMQLLTDTLAQHVNAVTGAKVTAVQDRSDGVKVSYRLNGTVAEQLFSKCVLALPPTAAAGLLPAESALQPAFSALPYACSVNVHFALSRPIGGRVQIIFPPHTEAPDLTTVVFEHNKGPGRAPPGKGALSLFWRDSWSRARMNLDEATIIRNTIPQARSVIPDFDESLIEAAHVERWAGAGVARQVGGTQAVVAVEAAGAKMHNLALAGDYSALSGVNAAVISGQIAAQKIIASKKINKNTVVRA